MVHKSMQNLTHDKRLARRRGWVDAAEREKVLAELPDVAAKGEMVGVEETPEGAAAEPPVGGSEA